jgi:hypothetical protein
MLHIILLNICVVINHPNILFGSKYFRKSYFMLKSLKKVLAKFQLNFGNFGVAQKNLTLNLKTCLISRSTWTISLGTNQKEAGVYTETFRFKLKPPRS